MKTCPSKIMFPAVRARRLRINDAMRNLVQENRVDISQLVLPLFIKAGKNVKRAIAAISGHFQLGLNDLSAEISEIQSLHIPAVILFGIPEKKDAMGSAALEEHGIIQEAVTLIKKIAPTLLVITDLCFCEYTDHGHCGVIDANTKLIDNDKTLELLAKQAVSHARAGADMVAPSGMIYRLPMNLRSVALH